MYLFVIRVVEGGGEATTMGGRHVIVVSVDRSQWELSQVVLAGHEQSPRPVRREAEGERTVIKERTVRLPNAWELDVDCLQAGVVPIIPYLQYLNTKYYTFIYIKS